MDATPRRTMRKGRRQERGESSGRSRNSRHSGISFKTRIKAQDPVNAMLFHNGQMNGIASGEPGMTQDNFLGALGRGPINRKYFVRDSKQRVEPRLDGVATMDRDVAADDLLKYFGIRDQALALTCESFQYL